MKLPTGQNYGGPWLFNPPSPQANTTDVRGLVDPDESGKYETTQPSVSPVVYPAGANMAMPDAIEINVSEHDQFAANEHLQGRHQLELSRSDQILVAGGWLGYWFAGDANPYDWVLAFGKYNDAGVVTTRWWLFGLLDTSITGVNDFGSPGFVYFFRKPVEDNRPETFTTRGADQQFDPLRPMKFVQVGGGHSIITEPSYA